MAGELWTPEWEAARAAERIGAVYPTSVELIADGMRVAYKQGRLDALAEGGSTRADRRRQYACAALTGLLANEHDGPIVKQAWIFADAMLEEEERGDG